MEKLIHDFSFGLFFFQIAIVVILILALKKYAWGPILDAINSREDGIREALESAESARIEMQDLKADNEKLFEKAREERDEMLKEAREIKEKMIAEATEEAEEKGNNMIAKAKAAIEAEKQLAMAEIKSQMADLSIGIAEKVVKQELDDKDKQMQLVNDMLKDVELN
ncbi:MAG TPA: F0F1 ATP synthase subunit B [Flavobacteriaceae bacterium]|nr:F0F1 ATP synthase subunit B [Flavobacteriaceae bacterium]